MTTTDQTVCGICEKGIERFLVAKGYTEHPACQPRVEPTCRVCGKVSGWSPCHECNEAAGGYVESSAGLDIGREGAARIEAQGYAEGNRRYDERIGSGSTGSTGGNWFNEQG